MTKKRKGREKRRIEERQGDQTQCLLSPGDSKLSSSDKVSSSSELYSLIYISFTFDKHSSLLVELDHQFCWWLSGSRTRASSVVQVAPVPPHLCRFQGWSHCSLALNDFLLDLGDIFAALFICFCVCWLNTCSST